MRWSLSEFLGLLEIRSQCWCVVEVGEDCGFSIRHSDSIFFYAALDGTARINVVEGGTIELEPGEIVMLTSGAAHAVRCQEQSKTESLEFLNGDSYVDSLSTFKLGNEPTQARILCSRLKVRWPFGQKPEAMPAVLRTKSSDAIVSVRDLSQLAGRSGATAVLTRAASLLFTVAFWDCPACETLFRASYKHDRIARAKEIIEKHPFKDWTVEILARKVGMGRSNFAAHFAAEVGKTPMEFVTQERMRHAAKLLEHTDLKIAAISEHIGYKSEAAFSRCFSSYFGVSPGKMRRGIRLKE